MINLKEYFVIYQEHFKNIESWKLLMVFVSGYQLCDVVITTGDAIKLQIEGEKYMLIYRILIQMFLVVFFHPLMGKLQKQKSGMINLITLIKFFCVIICWEETDYYVSQIWSRELDKFAILICFVLAIQSPVCQSLSLLFNVCYSLTRHYTYNSKIDIFGAVRLGILHVLLQIFVILTYESKSKTYSNSQLMALSAANKVNYTQLSSQRAGSYQRHQLQIDMPDNRGSPNLPQEIKLIGQQEDQQTESIQQDQFYEQIMNGQDCGIYQIESTVKIVQILNSFLSNLLIRDDQFCTKFYESQLFDFGILEDEKCLVIPTFHRSKDITSFLQFTQTLEVQLNMYEAEITQPTLSRLQLFAKNMSIKTFLDHMVAFNHLKFTKSRQLIDFSIKVYVKMDSQYIMITVTPILYKLKPQLVLFIYNISDDPYITQMAQNNKNSDYLISDISQKIKQPLNCTISMLEIVMNTTPQDLRDRYISPALAGCKLLINTANDILDYTQLQKRMQLDLQQMDVHIQEFLGDIIDVVKSQAVFRGLEISVNIKQNVPQFIRTDPNRLRQILINLLVASIQATVKGSLSFSVMKSQSIPDHFDFIIKVKAKETNFSVLKIIDKTVRFFKAQNLKSKLMDLANLRQYSQSILISFYISKCLSAIPFEYNYQRIGNKEEFNFIVKIQNFNPHFNQLLSQRRQSALANQMSFHQQFISKVDERKRHQSQTSHMISEEFSAQMDKNEKDKIMIRVQSPIIIKGIQERSQESDDSNSDLQDDEASIESKKEGIAQKIDKMLKVQPQFFDYVNENKKKSDGFISQPSQQLTFGGLGQGRSSIYSSLCFTSGTMQPNDLLDCFEKMEKIKQQKFKANCQCTKILICEGVDLDLYALSHQLKNLGIMYEYITQKTQIASTLNKLLKDVQTCCKGLQLLFMAVEQYDEELINIFNEIKEQFVEFKSETKIIGLIGCLDEENRNQLRKLPFHDYLSKPIMIDALLFILAKWIKIQ